MFNNIDSNIINKNIRRRLNYIGKKLIGNDLLAKKKLNIRNDTTKKIKITGNNNIKSKKLEQKVY